MIKCSKCRKELEENKFYKTKYGYHRYCKECQKDYSNMQHLGISDKKKYYYKRKAEIEEELNNINRKIKEFENEKRKRELAKRAADKKRSKGSR